MSTTQSGAVIRVNCPTHTICLILCLFLLFLQGHAAFVACTQEEAFAAEASISDISTWKELYESYKLYNVNIAGPVFGNLNRISRFAKY